MMTTITLRKKITPRQYKMVVDLLKAVDIEVYDDTQMSREELSSKIEKSKKQIKKGESAKLSDYKDFNAFVDSL